MKKFLLDLFDWLVLPMGVVLAAHFVIWAVASFIVWDIFWISAFWHRLLFAALCFFVWGTLIEDAAGDSKEKGK